MFQRGPLSFVAGATVGGALTYLYVQQSSLGGDGLGILRKKHPALKYGVPETSVVRQFSNFLCEFDYAHRNPKWVLERIPRAEEPVRASRKGFHFKEDEGIDEDFRSTFSHFRRSGYDRGHMAPAADNKNSEVAMRESFYLTNTAPQVGKGFNQDYWARFERFLYELRDECTDVYVVTGPLYLPRRNSTTGELEMYHKFLGMIPRLMSIPTHYYKVVVADVRPGSKLYAKGRRFVGSFVMPNDKIHPKAPLSSFSVPISSLEQVAGIRFFPELLSKDIRKYIDDVSWYWQQEGRGLIEDAKDARVQLPSMDVIQGHPAGIDRPSADIDRPSAELSHGFSNSNIEHDMDYAVKHARDVLSSRGLQHVCDHSRCALPPEKFWEMQKKFPAEKP